MRKLILCVAFASPAFAQSASTPSAVATTRTQWKAVTDYITRAAEQVPESLYAFRPVATVRTFGQLIAHIAGAQGMYCSIAIGDTPRAEDEIESSKTAKAELVAALKASSAYCERAYAQADADAERTVTLFGRTVTRLHTVMANALHNGEHYGNIVTYMRINGLVPPSSQRGG
jgi:uncharacterized damage-inducible protein DinB